ncbi:ATP-binding cassette domain-containing protein [Pelosinus sp. UFO1]|uniref:ATP-binding cassette domain-containing protein n=1 Tax=Pelosinus sp. UFO1 TaxID=484770 RepID=UPI0004D1DD48|nr:ATP-binding cassette domain-containing protein [Pelosinus sp. UFO1]AIF50824.1 ABC transporter related protein [Pelosinus sp. UFO1]
MRLQVTNLMKIYKGSITALHDVSCSVGTGIVGLIGPNASGKTTFLKIVAGLEEPTAGEVYFDGLELMQNKQLFRSMIGYLPQEFGFHKAITGEVMLDYIAVLKGIYDKKIRRHMVDEAIDGVNLNEARKLIIGEYSFGMKRRLGIAQALLGRPRILILDEAMEGLDPEESRRLEGLIAEVAGRSLVVISTHSLSNVFGCSTLLVLREGYMLYKGTPVELIGLADGLVWQVETDYQQMEKLKMSCKILGVQEADRHVVVRVLSAQKPHGKAMPAKARIEEGYLALMNAGVQP